MKINISLPWESYGGIAPGRAGKTYNHPSYQVQAGLTLLGTGLSFLGPASLSCVQRQGQGRLSTFFASLGGRGFATFMFVKFVVIFHVQKSKAL